VADCFIKHLLSKSVNETANHGNKPQLTAFGLASQPLLATCPHINFSKSYSDKKEEAGAAEEHGPAPVRYHPAIQIIGTYNGG